MPGRKLTLMARSCTTSIRRHTTAAPAALVPLRMRSPVTSPKTDEAPTTTVITISMGENVPEMTWAQPRRNSQIRVINKSQHIKQGKAVHLLHRESRSPRMTVGQTGAVCTMWRSTPCDTTPTTYSAAIRKSALNASTRGSLGRVMVRPPNVKRYGRGVFHCLFDVRLFQFWIIGDDRYRCLAARQEAQDELHWNTKAADARFPVTPSRSYRDAVEGHRHHYHHAITFGETFARFVLYPYGFDDGLRRGRRVSIFESETCGDKKVPGLSPRALPPGRCHAMRICLENRVPIRAAPESQREGPAAAEKKPYSGGRLP